MEDTCYIINVLMDILETFRANARCEDFRKFLNSHIVWLSSITSDTELYHPSNKKPLVELKNFLEDPEEHLEDFIELFQEYMDIKYAFRHYHDNNDDWGTMDSFFTDIVSDLEYILYRMLPADYETMKEKNRQFYHEINKYVLKPERIEKMAQQFGIEFFDYMDAIAV